VVLTARRTLLFESLALVAILGLAAWLRLAGLDRTSLFGDEAVYSGQAAALAGDAAAANNFGIFLAHPVLFQILLGLGFAGGLPIEGGRALTALFGVGSVVVAWAIGRFVGGRLLGLTAAALLAVLAYDAYLSRLVLLDGPAAFTVGCSLYAFLRAEHERSGTWLAASAAVLALAVLVKETAVLVLAAVAVAAALEPRLRLGLRAWLLAAASFVAVVAAFPISLLLGGGIESTMTYLHYQLGRHAQSAFLTYFHLIDPYFGWPFVALALIGLLVALWRGGGRRIIAIWGIVPGAFLQAWGLRELQLPMLVVLQGTLLCAIGIEASAHEAAAILARWGAVQTRSRAIANMLATGLLGVVYLSLLPATLEATSLPRGQPAQSGLREASLWLQDHADPADGVFVSTAYKSSVVAYYSGEPAYGFIPHNRRDPVYRDPGDVEAFWRAGGIQWVVLDRDSQGRAIASADERAPYARLVRLLDAHPHELAYEVPGPTADRWLARVYHLTPNTSGMPTVEAPAIVGRGDGRIVVLSYAFCIALGAGIIVVTRRPLAGQSATTDGQASDGRFG
jgi:hypothetical protein